MFRGRSLKLRFPPMIGKDVEAWARAAHRVVGLGGLSEMATRPVIVRRTYGKGKAEIVRKAQAKIGVAADGVVGPGTKAVLEPFLDAYARSLLKPAAPELVEPRQGWHSLAKSGWVAYSLGRSMGLTDLGTYNPASRLPGGGPSDHALFPAQAFDLGVEPDTGWANETGRRFFEEMVGRPEVEYVILGDKIWSRSRGLHAYTAGGHMNHVHVSLRH